MQNASYLRRIYFFMEILCAHCTHSIYNRDYVDEGGGMVVGGAPLKKLKREKGRWSKKYLLD